MVSNGSMSIHIRFTLNSFFTVLTLGILSLSFVAAQNTTWEGGNNGVWNLDENWSNDIPTSSSTALFSNNPAEAPVNITVTPGATAYEMQFSHTGNRSYVFSGDTIHFHGHGTSDRTPRIFTTNAGMVETITFNNDIFFTNTTFAEDVIFNIGGTVASTSHFSTLIFNGDILTDIPLLDGADRTLRFTSHTDSVIILNGSTNAKHVSVAAQGEIIINNKDALGSRAAVQKIASNTLSLRSNLTITGQTNGYSWTTGTYTTSIRISEIAPSSENRTITMEKRIIGTTGGFQWIDNINSTGKLIVDLKYSGGTVQTGNFLTNDSAIVRFSQTGDTTYSGVISGTGQVEKTTGTGITTLSGENTYTGDTVVTAGTLLLDSAGKLNFLIENSGINNQLTGNNAGNLVINGTFTFDLSNASSALNDRWEIVDMENLESVTFGATFMVENFTRNENIWTFENYQFNQLTGTLSVIPEPASFLLLSFSALPFLLQRKSRR